MLISGRLYQTFTNILKLKIKIKNLPFSRAQASLSDDVTYGLDGEEGGAVSDVIEQNESICPVKQVV